MKQRLSNLKYRIETVLWGLVSFFIIFILVMLFLAACPAKAGDQTWCQGWVQGTTEQQFEFLASRRPMVLGVLNEKRPDKKTQNEAAMECYITNIKDLKSKMDADCQVEKTLTSFFQQQVNTSDQEQSDIADYINHCVELADGSTT